MPNVENVARGKRSRSSGLRYQREIRKQLERISGQSATKFAPLGGSEENWIGLPWRCEVKSGAQIKPAYTAFQKMIEQSERNLPDDPRPFLAIIKTPRKPALILVTIDDFERIFRNEK